MQSETMPSELNLSPPPTIPQARTYISKQQSEYTEYNVTKGTKIRVDIPRLQRSYLMKDSYLRFRLNVDVDNANTANMILCFERAGAFAIFDRIEVYDYLGGTLLEQTNNIPVLTTLLNDIDMSIQDSCGKLSANSGMATCVGQFLNNTTNDNKLNVAFVSPPVNGDIIADLSADADPGRFVTIELSIPVMSFLGMWSDKYVPLHNGFSIYFYLNDFANFVMARTGNTGYNSGNNDPSSIQRVDAWISNFEYVCNIMELGEQAESIVLASEPLVVHSKQYRHFRDIILGSGKQSNFRFDLNLNVVSLRNLFFTMIPVLWQNNITVPSYSHRIRNFLQNWNFQYGSSYLPEIAGISCRSSTIPNSRNNYVYAPATRDKDWFKALGYTQCLEELSKCSGSRKTTNIDKESFMIDLSHGAPAQEYDQPLTGPVGDPGSAIIPFMYQGSTGQLADDIYNFIGKFAGGLNTRLSNKSTVSGIDTNGLQLSINGQFEIERISDMVDAYIDVFAEHDTFIQIIPGVATTVTF